MRKAQTNTSFSQYFINPAIYNPSAIGTERHIEISLLNRKEWTSFPGAPSSNLFNAHMPIKHEQMGIGLQVGQESIIATKKWHVNMLYAYKINFFKGKLSFGAKIGLGQTKFNSSSLAIKDEQDAILLQTQNYQLIPTLGFGLWFTQKRLSVGIAAFDLSPSSDLALISKTSGERNTGSYSAQVHYLVPVNASWNIDFYLLYIYLGTRTNIGLVTGLFNYKNALYLGSSYRTNKSVSFVMALKLDKLSSALENVKIGYSYDLNLSSISKYAQNTHEITLNLSLEKPKSLKNEKQKPKEISPYDL